MIILAFASVVAVFFQVTTSSHCGTVESNWFTSTQMEYGNGFSIRHFDPASSNNTSTNNTSCLNYTASSQSCESLRHAIFGDSNSAENVTVYIAKGSHILHDGLQLNEAKFVSLISLEGPELTILECGKNPVFDECQLKNVHLINSQYVLFSGLTFTKCQPLVAFVHVQDSDQVVFENCIFRYC